VEATGSDDLKIIEGIGPKISTLLNSHGVYTFTELANADPRRLEAILQDARMPYADPSSWPEQARLAAQGNLDALQALQARLKGGRRA
jgi:predicted flap endonuclease-1-like 5' DNA nuclease